MCELHWPSDDQLNLIRPFFTLSHGAPRVDGRRVFSGILLINHNGLRWRNTPLANGPYKTIYNRFVG